MKIFGFECEEVINKMFGGVCWKFSFDNGYGASIINDGYGKEKGLYELAVLDSKGSIDYSTPITNDVVGYLKEGDVKKLLRKISKLKKKTTK